MSDQERKIYVFGDQEIAAPADLTVEQVREVWSEAHPALANADAETDPETGVTTFRVRGGTKGC